MPVQIAIVTKDGVEELVEGEEAHTELQDLVDLWKAKEVETLGELAPHAAEGPAAEAAAEAAAAGEPEQDEPTLEEAEING
jgi:hypothetical protein